MSFVDEISSSLAAVQSRIASFSAGALPSDQGSGFAAVLASVTGATADPAAALGAGVGAGSGTVQSALDALSSAGATGSGTVTGAAVVADASKYLGVPYKWGGTDPSVGLDCSGLVQLTFKDLGIALPRGAAAQAQMGTAVPSLAQAQPGDLVAFGTPVDHIGIYAGNGMMVVAPHTGAQVRYEKITVTPSAIRRIVPSDPSVDLSSLASITGLDPTSLGTASLTSSGSASGPYADLFNAAGTKYGIDPRILSAVAHAESNYTPTAASGAGAQGLMQLMPGTAASLGVNALDPAQAVDGAARMLSGLLQRFGNLPEALAAYNAGSGAVARYGGIPPYPETRAYVSRVLGYLTQEGA